MFQQMITLQLNMINIFKIGLHISMLMIKQTEHLSGLMKMDIQSKETMKENSISDIQQMYMHMQYIKRMRT